MLIYRIEYGFRLVFYFLARNDAARGSVSDFRVARWVDTSLAVE